MADEPRVRAWWGKTTLARVRAQPQADELLAAIGNELVELFEHSTRLAWIPMTQHAALCERLLAHVGARRFVEILSTPEPDPVVAANMQARIGVVGDDPLVLLRHTANIWADIAADAGTLVVSSEGPTSALLSLENLPPVAMSGWLKLSFEALVARALRATHVKGKVETSGSTASRMLAIRVSW